LKYLKITLIFFLNAFIFGVETAGAKGIMLLTPDYDSILYARMPTTHLVVEVQAKETLESLLLRSRAGEVEPFVTRMNNDAYYVHYRVSLVPGKNEFVLSPGGQHIVIDYKPLRTLFDADLDAPDVYLYHRQGIMHKQCRSCHEFNVVPKGNYTKSSPYGSRSPICYSCHKGIFEEVKWQHSPAANLLCEMCHREGKDGAISVFIGKNAVLCYQCHLIKGKPWGDMAHIHAPVGYGVCSICHNPHGDKYRFQLWADARGELCVSCHEDMAVLLEKNTKGIKVHGIVKGGGCVTCHDPHASDNAYMLYKPINQLCTGCHNDFAEVTQGHPVVGHPVSGPSNPLYPGEEFSCASCHDPHGSKFEHLLIGDLLSGHFCIKCHDKRAP